MAGEPLVAFQPGLELLDDLVLSHRDDRGGARRQALADRLELVVLEALVADLAPDPAARRADSRADDDARREDQAHEPTRDRAALAHLLAAGVGRLLVVHLAFGVAYHESGVDQRDRACVLHVLEILQRHAGRGLIAVDRYEHLECLVRHVPPPRETSTLEAEAARGVLPMG